MPTQTTAASTDVPADLIGDIATDAYIYAYPLILMELTRRIPTNVADTRQFGRAPMNQFMHFPAFPDATYKDVVRPNVDTLYSLMWFDVSEEPLLISVPDSGGRYYLLPDARHVDRRVRHPGHANDRVKRAGAGDRWARLARPAPCRRDTHL